MSHQAAHVILAWNVNSLWPARASALDAEVWTVNPFDPAVRASTRVMLFCLNVGVFGRTRTTRSGVVDGPEPPTHVGVKHVNNKIVSPENCAKTDDYFLILTSKW